MLRIAVEMFIAFGVAFGGVLGPLTAEGLTAEEWIAASVAGLIAAGARLRETGKTPKK